MSGFQLITESEPTSLAASKTHTLTCPEGKKVLGGGARIRTAEGQVVVDEAYATSETTYYAETRAIGGTPVDHGLTVSVACANVAP